MFEKVLSLIAEHDSFIITTHDPADADGLGAELIFAHILKSKGKRFRIINANPVPESYMFMVPSQSIECWDEEKHAGLPEASVAVMLDTADEYTTGTMKEIIEKAQDVFVIDHHEHNPHETLPGIIDTSASTCEILVELAIAAGVALDAPTATAAYAGIVYDTGYFSYFKTDHRTFSAALKLIEWGAVPHYIYQKLNESASLGALLLQKKAISSLNIYSGGRLATQVVHKEDIEAAGARYEDAEGFVNMPLKSRTIIVSVLVKETPEGVVHCSLRSKGGVNVAEAAHEFGGGGHAMAAGFKSDLSVKETLARVLAKLKPLLDSI